MNFKKVNDNWVNLDYIASTRICQNTNDNRYWVRFYETNMSEGNWHDSNKFKTKKEAEEYLATLLED